MTRLAIWNAESLLGREIKETLAGRRDLWDDLRLLSDAAEDAALVTEIAEEAALVQPATSENLEDVDLLFYCPASADEGALPDAIPESLPTVVVAGDAPVAGPPPAVAGVNAPEARLVTSAHAPLVGLAHLLHPLLPLGLEACAASVVLPSSIRGQEGIDSLLNQTRAILAFQPPPEDDLFGHQLAFNLVPDAFDGSALAAPLAQILGADAELAIQTWLGGVFHGLTIGAHVRLGPEVDEERVREALAASAAIEFSDEPGTLGPVSVAASAKLVLGPVETSTAPHSYWLRAVMDNLTLGGALNAIGVAEAILGSDRAGYTM